MGVTMVEIARHTNLSPATVSRVLNGKGVGFISEATRQRVLDAARELGFQSERLSRQPLPERTMVISVWMRHPERPAYARILRHLLHLVTRAGYDLVLNPVQDAVPSGGKESGSIRVRASNSNNWASDGVFAIDCPKAAELYVKRFPPGACPVVGMHCEYSEQADYVGLDLAAGVRQAIEHLASVGCRRIAHLSSLGALERVRTARAAGYEEAVQAAGCRPEIILAPDDTRASARDTTATYLRSHGTPDGLFCLNDDMAVGACRALRDHGVRVPADVAVVGCDGVEDSQYLEVPLTTLVQPVEEMCRLAWDVLARRMGDPGASLSQSVLKPELRLDASTRR